MDALPQLPLPAATDDEWAESLTAMRDVLTGVEADLEPVSFATFADLYPYCYRVASAVGLACLPIWGARGDAVRAAESAGIAFQLTNILRDLGEDRANGRVYLPQDELARFGCPVGIRGLRVQDPERGRHTGHLPPGLRHQWSRINCNRMFFTVGRGWTGRQEPLGWP